MIDLKIYKNVTRRNPALLTQEQQRQLKALKTNIIANRMNSSSLHIQSKNNFIFTLLDAIPVLRLLRLSQAVHPKTILGNTVKNYQVLFPSKRVPFGVNQNDRSFLDICLYYKNDYFDRSEIFVCDVVPAYIHIGLGTVCTKNFQVIIDSEMQHRWLIARWRLGIFQRLSLLWAKYLPISAVYVFSLSADNFWHFLYDCIPRIYSTIIARPHQKLTVLVPTSLPISFQELLESVLPEEFDTLYVEKDTWVKVERLIMPSFISRLENGFLPSEYYEYIRACVFKKLELAPIQKPTDRIYISRSRAKHRRVLNENQVIQYLEKFGFKTVVLEEMSFREQVELFTKAAVIISPHGAGLATTMFSGSIKILVLYPERSPTPFFFTQFKGLGQEHYFLAHDQFDEDADFEVDMDRFKQVLHEQVKLPSL